MANTALNVTLLYDQFTETNANLYTLSLAPAEGTITLAASATALFRVEVTKEGATGTKYLAVTPESAVTITSTNRYTLLDDFYSTSAELVAGDFKVTVYNAEYTAPTEP